MKDRQVESAPPLHRIPVVSTILHCVAMPSLVFLRSGFGFAFLKPRSLFFAFSWAFGLFCIYAYVEKHVWASLALLCIFGISAISLYWLHLTVAFVNELRGTATHDNDSGAPHTLRMLNLAKVGVPPGFETVWVLWVEPALLSVAAVMVRSLAPSSAGLSTWLLITSLCLWLKEFLNYWFRMRHGKVQGDSLNDAEENMNRSADSMPTELPARTRKPKRKYQRDS